MVRAGDVEHAHLLLRNADTLLASSAAFLPAARRNQLYAVTYSNFACYHKRVRDFPVALQYAGL